MAQNQKKYSVFKAPTELLNFIELANLLPSDAIKTYNLLKENEENEELVQALAKELLPKDIFEFICYEGRIRYNYSIDQLFQLIQAKRLFSAILEINEIGYIENKDYLDPNKTKEIYDKLRKHFVYTGLYQIAFPLRMELEGFADSSILKPDYPDFVRIFDNHDIDIRLIRKCVICSNFFWAKREKSLTCSRHCVVALQSRRHREVNKEIISLRRQRNYYKKKWDAARKKLREAELNPDISKVQLAKFYDRHEDLKRKHKQAHKRLLLLKGK